MALARKIIQVKQDATDARLSLLDLPDGATWITEARNAAMSRVKKMSLPHGRDEYWKLAGTFCSRNCPSC